MQADEPAGSSVVVKNEPSSPAGMDIDVMPEVHDRCGVCQQQCPPSEAQTLAVCLRCSSRVHTTCDSRAADAMKVGAAAAKQAFDHATQGTGHISSTVDMDGSIAHISRSQPVLRQQNASSGRCRA